MAQAPLKPQIPAPRPKAAPSAGPVPGDLTATEIIAIALSLLWLVGVGVFFLFAGRPSSEAGFDSLRFVMTLMAVFLPVAMIWVAAAAARSSRIMREESRRLQASVDAMRQTYLADRQAQALAGAGGAVGAGSAR